MSFLPVSSLSSIPPFIPDIVQTLVNKAVEKAETRTSEREEKEAHVKPIVASSKSREEFILQLCKSEIAKLKIPSEFYANTIIGYARYHMCNLLGALMGRNCEFGALKLVLSYCCMCQKDFTPSVYLSLYRQFQSKYDKMSFKHGVTQEEMAELKALAFIMSNPECEKWRVGHLCAPSGVHDKPLETARMFTLAAGYSEAVMFYCDYVIQRLDEFSQNSVIVSILKHIKCSDQWFHKIKGGRKMYAVWQKLKKQCTKSSIQDAGCSLESLQEDQMRVVVANSILLKKGAKLLSINLHEIICLTQYVRSKMTEGFISAETESDLEKTVEDSFITIPIEKRLQYDITKMCYTITDKINRKQGKNVTKVESQSYAELYFLNRCLFNELVDMKMPSGDISNLSKCEIMKKCQFSANADKIRLFFQLKGWECSESLLKHFVTTMLPQLPEMMVEWYEARAKNAKEREQKEGPKIYNTLKETYQELHHFYMTLITCAESLEWLTKALIVKGPTRVVEKEIDTDWLDEEIVKPTKKSKGSHAKPLAEEELKTKAEDTVESSDDDLDEDTEIVASVSKSFVKPEKHVPEWVKYCDDIRQKVFILQPIASTISEPRVEKQRRFSSLCLKDAGYHLSVLGSTFNFVQTCLEGRDVQHLRSAAFPVLRSISVMVERYLTSFLECGSSLSHSHVRLAKDASIWSHLSLEHQGFLTSIDRGTVFTRYCHNSRVFFKQRGQDIPQALLRLLHPETMKTEHLVQMMMQSLDFMEACTKIRKCDQDLSCHVAFLKDRFKSMDSASKSVQKKPVHYLNSRLQSVLHPLTKEIHELVLKIDLLRKAEISEEEKITWLEVKQHLMGISQGIQSFTAYPTGAFLLKHGDTLWMHMQYLLEQLEAIMHLRKFGPDTLFRMHDIVESMDLRHADEESKENIEVINALNTICAHYPHKRVAQIKKHNLKDKEHHIDIPYSLLWRMEVMDVERCGDACDGEGMQPAKQHRKGKHHKKSENAMPIHYDRLVNALIRTIAMASSKINYTQVT